MSRPNSFSTCVYAVVLAFFAFAATASSSGQTPPVSAIIEPGKALTVETNGAERRSFQFTAAAGNAVRILIRQLGVDVSIRLYDPDNKLLTDFDFEPRPDSPEILDFVTASDGGYRIEVAPRYPLLPAGKYEVLLARPEPSTPRDRALSEAVFAYRESVQLLNAGKYDESRRAAERSAEIRKSELGADDPLTLTSLTQLARVVDATGKFDEAEKLNTEILAARTRVLGVSHPDVALSLNYLALNNNHKENFAAALEFHERALAIREKIFGASHALVAVSLINLGVVYDALGDKLKAGELYERAAAAQEKSVGADNVNFAIILTNTGKVYDDLGEFKRAEPFLVRAGEIFAKVLPPESPRIYDFLVNLADCYSGQGRYDKAEPLYLRLVAFYTKSVGADHPRTAIAEFNLANVYSVRREFALAEPLYRRALATREDYYTDSSPLVSEVASALAYLLAEKGAVDEALALQERVNDINERSLNLNLALGSERQKLAFLAKRAEELQQSLTIESRFAPNNPKAAEIGATSVLRRKGRVLDAVSNSLSELRRRFAPADRALLDELNSITKELAEAALEGRGDGESNDAFAARIKKLSDRRETLENDIGRNAAGFFEKTSPVTLAAVRASIPADAALLEYVLFAPVIDAGGRAAPTHYGVYVIRADGRVQWKDLGDAAVIEGRVNAFRQALHDPKRLDATNLARQVEELLIAPVRGSLGGSRQLLISPDGTLNLIPFEALADGTGQFLIEKYAVTYLTSGRDLLRLKTGRESQSSPLIVANSSFGAPRGAGGLYFPPLSGTKLEAASIKSIMPGAVVLEGDAASETALKKATAPSILHIATHGFFLADNVPKDATMRGLRHLAESENPLLRSGLALAGANLGRGGDDDGVLTALEATGLNLRGTKLVVLSACETGVGEVRSGEGVYGLRRAFVLAGAESMVMSLWSISDFATRELMTGYYKNLERGLGRGEALRQVQLSLLARAGRRHPFYWAGFIQSGNWTPLK